MNRQQHETHVKTKILNVSSTLFKEKGFTNTTIRQITSAADIRIGTLYYFFKDKEAIFHHLVHDYFIQISKKADQLVPEDKDRLRFACETALQLDAIIKSKKTAEMYFIAYNSYSITREVLEQNTEKYKAIFRAFNPLFTEEDYLSRSLSIKGHIQAIAMEVINGQILDPELFIPKTITAQFELFNVPSGLIKTTLQKMEETGIKKLYK